MPYGGLPRMCQASQPSCDGGLPRIRPQLVVVNIPVVMGFRVCEGGPPRMNCGLPCMNHWASAYVQVGFRVCLYKEARDT